MNVVLTLVVCLLGAPDICETVTPDMVRAETGLGPTLLECLGEPGQELAQGWQVEHPEYRVMKIQCSVANGTAEQLRDRVTSPRA